MDSLTETGAKYSVWIMSGETSGDIYGASLAVEIKKLLGDSCSISGMGGPEMRKAGVDIIVDSSELGVMGGFEAIGKIIKCVGIFMGLCKKAAAERPDLVITIDYPGFNIRFAKKMWRNNIPVLWYISPQVWAWRKSNIPKLAKYCRKMMVIFPFEPDVYKGTGLDVEFVGHPLVDIVTSRADAGVKRDDNLLLLLPGSREGEIERLLEPMLGAVLLLSRKKPELKYVLSSPRDSITCLVNDRISSFRAKHPELPNIEVNTGETGDWMQSATAGLAASGTVTVESAIAGLPLVVAYKLNPLSFMIARMIITLFRGFFTMTNIILEKEVFQEFLQHQVTPGNLSEAVERILPGGDRRESVDEDMKKLVGLLGGGGACANAAGAVVRLLRQLKP